ncbi:MAG TPA: type II CAAX endopeptidase family protein [Candidatus Aquicultor sp.]
MSDISNEINEGAPVPEDDRTPASNDGRAVVVPGDESVPVTPGDSGLNGPRVPWTLRDALLALVWFIFIITGGSFIIIKLIALVSPKVAPILAMFIGYALLVILLWYFAVHKRGATPAKLGFRPFDVPRGFGLAIAWFFLTKLFTAVYAAVAQWLGIHGNQQALENLPQIFGKSVFGFILAALLVAVVAPLVEELFFRGFVYPAFRQRWGVTAGVIASSVLFSLFHFNAFLFIPIMFIGIALAYLYETTGSLWPSIMLHALNNFLSVILIYYSGVLPIQG